MSPLRNRLCLRCCSQPKNRSSGHSFGEDPTVPGSSPPQKIHMSAVTSHPVPQLMLSGSSWGSQGILKSLHPICGWPPFQALRGFPFLLSFWQLWDEAPGRFGRRAGEPLFFMLSCPPYFLLNLYALCCSYTSDQSRRKNVLSVFSLYLDPAFIPTTHMSNKGRERENSVEGGGWGEVCPVSASAPLTGLSIFLHSFLMPRPPALEKRLEQLTGRGQSGRSSDLNFIGYGLIKFCI